MEKEELARRRAAFKESYPINLLLTINEDVFDGKLIAPEDMTQDTFDGLFHVLTMLSEREQDMLRLRFEERHSFSAIGNAFGVSQERARYIIRSAMRKMRQPAMFAYLKYGKQGSEARRLPIEKKEDSAPDSPVNLNTASWKEMSQKLGYRVAGSIEKYRERYGGFRDVEELQRIHGVGAKTFERLKDKVCV